MKRQDDGFAFSETEKLFHPFRRKAKAGSF
jgi:hypothetical protein